MKVSRILCALTALLGTNMAFAVPIDLPPQHTLARAADEAVFDFFRGKLHQTWGHVYENNQDNPAEFSVTVFVDGKYKNSYQYGMHKCYVDFLRQPTRKFFVNFVECEPIGD